VPRYKLGQKPSTPYRSSVHPVLSGLDTSGLDTSGLDTSGLDTSGLDTSGLDTSGLEPLFKTAFTVRGKKQKGFL